MPTLSYKNLLNRTISTAPYRGTNEYPMGSRSLSYSRFSREVDLDDSTYYKIYYGDKWQEKEITKEFYEANKNVNGICVRQRTDDQHWLRYEYSMDTRVRNCVAIVRPNNMVEFTAPSLHQGVRMKLCNWTNGVVYQNCRLGGVVFSNTYPWRRSQLTSIVPLFHGLRVDADTFEADPTQKIQLFRNRINRKVASSLLKEYREMMKVSESMISCMDLDNLMMQAKDVLEEFGTSGDGSLVLSHQKFVTREEAFTKGAEIMREGRYFDATVLMMIGMSMQGMNCWSLNNYTAGQSNWYRSKTGEDYAKAFERQLPKILYRENKPFHEEEIEFGKPFKPTEWGVRIVVNGVDVQQY